MNNKFSTFVLVGILACVLGVNAAPANSTNCPYPCTQGGQHYCQLRPCYRPPCADPVKDKGACCPHCPNGPNCEIYGQIVPQGGNRTINNQLCECVHGGDSHSALVVYNPGKVYFPGIVTFG